MASPLANLIHHTDTSHPNLYSSPLPAVINTSLAPPAVSPSLSAPASSSTTPTSGVPRSHSNTQSLYQCADCLRRYSRPEHLQRHIATHTLGKRFTCDICSKAFSRADLLKRHRANHQDDNGTKRRRINSSPGAGRVAHACQACAKARVKCEELKPCSRCKNRGINCEYASSEDAAMHLLHLSANARNMDPQSQQESSPESPYYAPAAPPPQLQQVSGVVPLPVYPNLITSQAVAQSSPALTTNASLKDETQLLTPETIMDQGNPDTFQPSYPSNDNMIDMAKHPFGSFLHNILYDQPLADHSRLADAQGLAVLDYCDDRNLEMDFGLMESWNLDGIFERGPDAPELQSGMEDSGPDMDMMRRKLEPMWTESQWRWNPQETDTGFSEQKHLPLEDGLQGRQPRLNRVVNESLQPAGREKILAIALKICGNRESMMARVASSFPPREALDHCIHMFLASHMSQVSTFIHYPSFSLNGQGPEWLAIAASAGAVLAPRETWRRSGLALQEVVRLAIPSRFEENNTEITNIELVQGLILVQDVGLWSGNRRKMEIAECHLSIPIAMMRYRGRFRQSHHPQVVIAPNDEGEVLESKWKMWCEYESWKRLLFHAYLTDAQVSMTQLNNPSMSYAELTLPLPYSKALWSAESAEDFKRKYLELANGGRKRPPSLGDLFRDISLLTENRETMDLKLSISIYLHGFWALIWEYRQFNTVHLGNPNLLLSSRREELCRLLQDFQVATSACLSAQESLVLNLIQLNLHVSLGDIQIFTGKEGNDQARQIYSELQRWSKSSEARHALWHAGQILLHAKLFPTGHLKDFYAIAVYHAALCLWAYTVVTKATRQNTQPLNYEVVHLDRDQPDLVQVEQFISSGHGRAAIRRPQSSDSSATPTECFLEDTQQCMEVVQKILQANFRDCHDNPPPINKNIIDILKQLGDAAWMVGRR